VRWDDVGAPERTGDEPLVDQAVQGLLGFERDGGAGFLLCLPRLCLSRLLHCLFLQGKLPWDASVAKWAFLVHDGRWRGARLLDACCNQRTNNKIRKVRHVSVRGDTEVRDL
jgi:hypothetical protein